MIRSIGLLVLFAGMSLAQTSEDPLDLGAAAFKAKNFAEAVQHFQDAVNADPTNISAHLYLGRARQAQYIPGLNSPENLQYAERATEEFQQVLSVDAHNKLALSSLAALAFSEKKFDQAREWNKKVLTIESNNKEANYSLGVLAWMEWMPVDRQARAEAGQKPGDPGPIGNARVRQDLKAKWLPILDEAIKNEEAALATDATYEDAMVYMSRLIRRRADLLDNPEEYVSEVQRADVWDKRSLAARDTKAPGPSSDLTHPATPPARVDASRPIRVGGAVAQASLISQVPPNYPPLARQARISGTVRFNVRIDKEGRVEDVTLMSGHPLLAQAAMDAVKQWVYKPTLLNGNPVEVLTTVDVNFVLQP